jgi:hypothetical protein
MGIRVQHTNIIYFLIGNNKFFMSKKKEEKNDVLS